MIPTACDAMSPIHGRIENQTGSGPEIVGHMCYRVRDEEDPEVAYDLFVPVFAEPK